MLLEKVIMRKRKENGLVLNYLIENIVDNSFNSTSPS